MKKLLLSLSIVAFAFSQSMVMAGSKVKEAEVAAEDEDSEQEETTETKSIKKYAASKVKEGATAAFNKIDYLRRSAMGKLTPEEQATESKKKAEQSKKKISEKDLKKFNEKMEEASKDFGKMSQRIERAAEKFEKLFKDTKDKKIGSVEDVSLNIALNNAIRSFDYFMLPLSVMFDMYKSAKKSNTLGEFRQQAALAQYSSYRWRRSFAVGMVNLVKAFNESRGIELFNQESVVEEMSVFREKLVNGDGKNATGKDIMTDYNALVSLAKVTKDAETKEFLETVKPAFELASAACTDVIRAMEEFVTDKINGDDNNGSELLKAIAKDERFGYTLEELEEMAKSATEEETKDDEEDKKTDNEEE